MHIDGKRILLTGASGGIGSAIAHELAARGATLILAGRNPVRLKTLIDSLPGVHRTVAADIATAEGRKSLLRASSGGIDILINNAGISHFGMFEDQTDNQIEHLITVNTIAPLLLCRLMLPLLKASKEAMIINVGSAFGSIGHAGFAVYSSTKFGLRGFSEALRRELAGSSVRVGYLSPRATRTEMNSAAVDALNDSLGNTTDSPQLVAAGIVRLLSSEGGDLYLGWPERFFVRLNGLLPALVDRAMRPRLAIIRKHAQPLSEDSRHEKISGATPALE